MDIIKNIKNFGCHDVVLLGVEPSPRHLEYLDLLKLSESKNYRVDAVAEFQARPMLYILSENPAQNIDEKKLINLQSLLGNRGERAYLGVLGPGQLTIYPINLDRSVLMKGNKKVVKNDSPEAPLLFQSMATGIFSLEGQPQVSDYVFQTIHELMIHSSETLIKTYGLFPLDVLSFLGRALFLRFLWDRKIIEADDLDSVCPKAKSLCECFSNIKNAILTCQWLDETFNGDLLPFSRQCFRAFSHAESKTNGELFLHLQAILEGWKYVGHGTFQVPLPIDWGDLNFAHIPIGVLSQVYETFSKTWDSQQRAQTSAYYTPKNIARYLVDDAFEGITHKKDAQILDPSCGAGIFLVLAFRKLFAERWQQDGKRPDTKAIQSILYNQLCGFDISESALRLSALSLYITAIELNGSPRPPKSLKFPKPLQGVVLFNNRRPEERDVSTFVMGSLHPEFSKNFDNRFDLVIGNPPWTRLKGKDEESKKRYKAFNKVFTKITRQLLEDRGLVDIAKTYNNPDNDPDLPFLWKSMQWAKPGGVVAMTLPARIFLKQSEPGIQAFQAILRGIEITGILNGSNLSDSVVWPGMSQPFMLFFALNRVPSHNHHFHFVTPHFEQLLNEKGGLRVDYQSAYPIAVSDVLENSGLLKTLAVGTLLDMEVVQKLETLRWPNIKSYWKSRDLYSGLGYNPSPLQKQFDSSFLSELPDFEPPQDNGFLSEADVIIKRGPSTAHRPRDPELYNPPLLIVPESPGSSPSSPKSWIMRSPTAFSKSYYGFSAKGSEKADIIISILHLITHADLFRYHILMTASRMGAERRTFLKENLENFLFPKVELLSRKKQQSALELSSQLETAPIKPWDAINDFIFDLYGLDEHDRQVVKDTLKVSSPYKESRDQANSNPSKEDRFAFYGEIQRLLAPSFAITDEKVTVCEIEIVRHTYDLPWYFFVVSANLNTANLTQAGLKKIISQITKEANRTGCSRAVIHEEDCIYIGIIGQYRYWTLSRARLCALDILRNHLDIFPVRRQ